MDSEQRPGQLCSGWSATKKRPCRNAALPGYEFCRLHLDEEVDNDGRDELLPRLVRAARAAKGWSQPQLETAAGLSRMDVYRAEGGASTVSARKAFALSVTLEIPQAVMRGAFDGDAPMVEGYIKRLADLADEARERGRILLEDVEHGPASSPTPVAATDQRRRRRRGRKTGS